MQNVVEGEDAKVSNGSVGDYFIEAATKMTLAKASWGSPRQRLELDCDREYITGNGYFPFAATAAPSLSSAATKRAVTSAITLFTASMVP